MRSLLAAVLTLLLVVSARADDAAAVPGRRVALVIGNAAYPDNRLTSPARDAHDVAAVLLAAGFKLVRGGPITDARKRGFEQAIEEFGRLAQGAEAAVFYYSGHGMEWNEQNWMIPVDDDSDDIADTARLDVSVNHVLEQMTSAQPGLSLVILDACRNDAPHATANHGPTGLGAMPAPDNTVIAFASQPGESSFDGPEGGNSAYTEQLLRMLKTPGLELFQVFNRAALATKEASAGRQRPWTNYSPISGDFYFFPPGFAPNISTSVPPAATADEPAVPVPAAPAAAAQDDPSFTLLNLSRAPISDLRVSLSDDRNWGENRASSRPIQAGGHLDIHLAAGGACSVETRVTLASGKQVRSENDTCRITTLVVRSDGTVAPANPSFTLVNMTGRAIKELYVSLNSETDWGDNRLDKLLASGATLDLDIVQGMGCRVDVKGMLANGATIERRNVETCSIDSWSLK